MRQSKPISTTPYVLTSDTAGLSGWTLTTLAAALRPALAPLGITVEIHALESGLGGLQSEDSDLRERVQAIVERIVSSTPEELIARTVAARALGSARSPRKAGSSRANGRRGGRPTVAWARGGEWGSQRVLRDGNGWIVETRSAITGTVTGDRIRVPYGHDWPEGCDLSARYNPITTYGAALVHYAQVSVAEHRPDVRVIRRGITVR